MSKWETVWSFDTDKFTVRLQVTPEDMDPADSFEFPEDIEAVRNGSVEWFCARVQVLTNMRVIGEDVLGGCCYYTVSDFYRSHWSSDYAGRNTLALKAQNKVICHYFPDMVRQAIADARRTLGQCRPHAVCATCEPLGGCQV